jgi:hypothetical protein
VTAVSYVHLHPDCTGRWDSFIVAGQTYVRCESCRASYLGEPETVPPAPAVTPERKYRDELAWALGYALDIEPPEWMDLVQQVRRDRTVRQEIELDAWGHVATALRALEKYWPQLNPHQQWSARDHLRSFARQLPKIDPAELPKSEEGER